MSVNVTHAYVDPIADDPADAAAGKVLPSHWNASHTLTATQSRLLGTTASSTTVGEIVIGAGLELDGSTLLVSGGVLSDDVTYYVRTDGSDSNDGLTNDSSGAKATVQAAYDLITSIDLAGFTVTIQIADGTYNLGAGDYWLDAVRNQPLNGTVVIQGNLSDKTAVQVVCSTADYISEIISNRIQPCAIEIKNITFQNNGAAGCNGFFVVASYVVFEDIGTTIGANGYHCIAGSNAYVTFGGACTIASGAKCYLLAYEQSFVGWNMSSLTATGTCNFSESFIRVKRNSFCIVGVGTTFTGTYTGIRFITEELSTITRTSSSLSLTFYPGDTAGIVRDGGCYSSPSGTSILSADQAWVGSTGDLILRRSAAANLAFGDVDAAAPVAQTLSVQNVVAGTADTAGVDFSITGSAGTGSGAGGGIVLKAAGTGAASTTQNTLAQIAKFYNPTAASSNHARLDLGATTDTYIIRRGTTKMRFGVSGVDACQINTTLFVLPSAGTLSFDNGGGLDSPATHIGSPATATIRLGAADAASPVAQTLSVQNVVTGTSNTAGANWTFQGSIGTGTGAGGSIIFKTAAAGSSGSTPNSATTSLTLAGSGTVTAGKAFIETVVALSDGATPALDASQGNIFYLDAAGDRTIAVPTNAVNGQKIVIRHFANGADRTLALNTGAGGFRFGTDITALTATTSGTMDYIGCIYNGVDSFWDVVAYTKGF